jgi:hypothetical protein
MKHFRFITLLLIAAIAITTNAEKVKKVTVLQQMGPMYSHFEKPVTDSITGLSTVKWQSTEDRHVKGRDDQWAKQVISVSSNVIENHFINVPFGRFRNMPNDLTPLYWELTEEDGETVLHCYMKMPAEVVTNFWLASEETGIVDAETGVHYRARRSEPDCWKRYFTFRAPKDSIVDFRIYFPPLPETVNDVYIYGVPNWNLRGDHTVAINRPVSGLRNSPDAPYDIAPEFHKPRLEKAEHDYDKNNSGTWSVYTDVHLIKPAEAKTFAIWRTKDATYLARATEQNWMREYFGRGGNNVLLDNNGRQYKLKDVMDYPNNNLFWVEGYSGDWFAIVEVYEPLPLNVKTFTFIVPEGEPFNAWGANWSGEVIPNLDVEQLRKNQRLFEYHPRVVVK